MNNEFGDQVIEEADAAPSLRVVQPAAPQMNEFGDPIVEDSGTSQARGKIIDAAKANPEDAAKAIPLGAKLNVPATLVEKDPAKFQQESNRRDGIEIAEKNPAFADFINSHPLAARVANDDYPKLDAVAGAVAKVGEDSILGSAVKGFKAGFDFEGLGKDQRDFADLIGGGPLARFIANAVSGPEVGLKAFTGLVTGGAAAIGQHEQQFGMSQADSEKLTRDLIVFANVGLSGQSSFHIHPALHAALAEAGEVAKAAEPHMMAGKEPPVGLHEVIDDAKVDQAKTDAKNLNEALSEAQGSKLRERNPDMFADYVRGITKGDIGISADAVRALYGDKVPAPDDGILGHVVPDLAAQLERADATGGDIQAPLADWLAKVDPEVAKELKDHIRARPEGMTVEEGKEPPEYEKPEGTTVQLHRGVLKDGTTGEDSFWAASPETAQMYAGKEGSVYSQEFTFQKLLVAKDWVDAKGKVGLPKEGGIRDLQRVAREKGYDGITFETGPNGAKEREYVVLGRPKIPAIDNVRQAAGLQGVQERKLNLKEQLESDQERLRGIALSRHPEGEAKAHAFDLTDSSGERQAQLFITEEKGGKRLYVDDFEAEQGPRALGPRAMRDLLEQIKEKFPNAESIEGMRVSGAREKADIDKGVERPAKDLKAALDLTKIKPRAKAPTQDELDVTRMEDKAAFDKPSAIGMTVDQYRRYQKLIDKRQAEDAAYHTKRAEAEAKQKLSAEWKETQNDLRPKVAEEVNSRPEIAADNFLRENPKVKIGEEYLTPEQKAALPKEFVAKDGLHPDDLASMMGEDHGGALIDSLAQLNADRAASGMNPTNYRRRLIAAELESQVEARMGKRGEEILAEAKDQVLSQTQEQMLHEEVLARASEAGLEYSIKADELKAALKTHFDAQAVRDVSSDKGLAEAGRAGRAAEMALLKGDYAEAFRQKQRQYNAFVMANYARKFEKAQASFEKLAKRYDDRQLKAVDQEYTNWTRDLLNRTGKLDPRKAGDLAQLIQRSDSGIKTLAEFVDYKTTHDLREVPVAEFLTDPEFRKPYENLTVVEAGELHDAVKTLDKQGREEMKFIRQGDAVDLAELKETLIGALERFKEKKYDTEGDRDQNFAGVRHAIRTAFVAHLQVETVFNRLDRYDAKGPWNQYVFRPLVEAANHEAKLEREFAKKLGAIADNVNLKEVIPDSPFPSPYDGSPMRMTRKNLRAVLLNQGNPGNAFKMAKGYGLEPEQVKAWLDTHATKQDWDWAQKMWGTLKELGERSDTMYRGLTGVAPEKIEIKPVETPHGTYDGGYYPLIRHDLYGQDVKLAKSDLEGAGYIRATTAAGYTKKRTGAIYPLSLDLDSLQNTIKQVIHDTSFRPAVIEAGKILYDNGVTEAFKKHLGAEYADMLVPWLKDVANTQNYYASKATKDFMQFSDFMRQNAITTLVGFNVGTVMKHTPTALASSMAEVGPANFLKAASKLLTVNDETGNSNWSFAMQHSEELQRRSHNWVETMGGGMRVLEGRTVGKALAQYEYGAAAMNLRDVITQVSSKPVAMGDLISAVPTWLARYTSEMEDHGVHGDAVFAADKSVRQAHGSSATTSKSAVARSTALHWFTGFFTFFNDLLNRQVETLWKAGDALGMAKEGEHAAAMKQGTEVIGRLFAYVVVPAVIEELVTPLTNKSDESWGMKAAKGLTFTLSSSYVFVREIVNAMLNGRDPAVGLLSTSEKTLTDMGRDLSAQRPNPDNIVKHGTMLAGMLTGLTPAPLGKAAEFAMSKERAPGPWGWLTGLRYGTLKGHADTFDRWKKGR